jgi:hypothetical protein
MCINCDFVPQRKIPLEVIGLQCNQGEHVVASASMKVLVFLVRHRFFCVDVGDDVDARCSLHGGIRLDAQFPAPDAVLVKTHKNFLVIGCGEILSRVLELSKPQRQSEMMTTATLSS